MTIFHLTTKRMHPKKSLILFQSHASTKKGYLDEYWNVRPIIRLCIVADCKLRIARLCTVADCELRIANCESVGHPILCTILCADNDTKIDLCGGVMDWFRCLACYQKISLPSHPLPSTYSSGNNNILTYTQIAIFVSLLLICFCSFHFRSRIK